jgi:hypothetical protein
MRTAAPWSRAAAAVALAGCRGLTDPPLPAGAERFAPPPVYARWWAMVEACAGETRPLGDVAWYRAPGASSVPAGRGGAVTGYWSRPGDRIVLAGFYAEDGGLVRHEMLHALVRERGHPRDVFLGRCAGVAPCQDECVRDAGPAPAADPAAVRVPPSALEVTAEVSPPAPDRAADDGHFTLTVRVRNPAPRPVLVSLPAAGASGADQGLRYEYEVSWARGRRFGGAGIDDPTGPGFAAGEARVYVFDFSVAPAAAAGVGRLPGRGWTPALGPGRYALTGVYAGRRSDPVTVAVGP